MLRDKTSIVGIGQSEYTRVIGRPEDETAYEVSRAALQDAGIDSREVDGIFHVEGQSGGAPLLARRLGARNLRSWASASGGGGADVNAHPAVGNGVHDAIGSGGLELLDYDVVGREQELATSCCGRRFDALGVFEAIALDERGAYRFAARGEERVCHGAADREHVGVRSESFEYRELVGNLGAA